MKKHLLTLFSFSFVVMLNSFQHLAFAQGTWTQKASLTGVARTNAVGFTLGTKGYICTGFDGTVCLNDLWEYDAVANSWTQKTSFPGAPREGAVVFTIGTKAYVGTGRQDTALYKDFYEYDQAGNSWTVKAPFGGTKRSEASAFSIGTMGYVGTGYDGTNTLDFWEYNQTTNTWLARANYPNQQRNSAIGFSLNNGKGIIGSGYASAVVYQDFWEYNPVGNSWAFVGQTNYQAYSIACFTLGTLAYYGTGIDDNAVYYNNFSSFDPLNGSTALTAFGGTNRYNACAFAISGRGYMGTGYDSWVTQDWWEYTPQNFSVEENNSEIQISLYPNPAVNNLELTIDNGQFGKGEIMIYDVTGNIVLQTTNCKPQTIIDVSSFSKGIYFLKISDGKKSAVKKLVKM